MKIWIDLTNSPHVNFFAGMIRELKDEHEVLITCRPLANTVGLLELLGFPHHVVGKHYGQNKVKKTVGFMIRIWQLYSFLKDKAIDVAISHSSFYSPVVARMLRVRNIYLNDNEHAEGNRISFVFADQIFVPEFLDLKKVRRQWAKLEKVVKYPGVKEGIYLWNYNQQTAADHRIHEQRKNKETVFVRPEPWTAQYYTGRQNFIDNLLMGLKDIFQIVLLPRGETQERYYRQQRFKGIIVPEKSIRLEDIMGRCDLFIGAGGTMTREAAVLGVPTISVYQDVLLDVDNFLIQEELMIHEKNPSADFVMNYLEKNRKKPPDKQLLQKGHQAYQLIKKTLVENNTK